ncbi:MAG: ParB/RepB/Spo0J family partition protein [Sulfurimonas sp.]|jgi:ParB/RepB/Spo0J family partition protein
MNLSALDNVTAGKTRTTGISQFSELDITKVYPNPEQPRKEFKNIEELANSIVKDGLLQPISVVKKENGYMIIGGERRYRASLHAGFKTIKSNILQVNDSKVRELALVENIQREDLTDFEKAKSIGELWASGYYKQKQDLAAAIGKSSSYISKVFSSLKLDNSIIQEIEENKNDISLSVLEEISRVKNKDIQKIVYAKYIAGEITRDDIKSFRADNIKKNSFKDKKNLQSAITEEGNDTITKSKKDIDDSISILKMCVSADGHIDKDNHAYGKGCGTGVLNDYEIAIFNLLKEFKEEIEELNKKEIYIVSYQHKKGVPHGGGYRTRALNQEEAIELGKEFYWEEGMDKNYIFEARALSSFNNTANLKDYISYGFGTQNNFGTFISLTKGDFIGSIKLESNTEIVTNSNDFNYQVILKKIDTPKEELREIKLIEVLSDSVYIEYTDFDSMELSFSKAKEMIKKSTQKSIPYVISKSNDKSCDFINKMPNRTQNNGNLVLRNSKGDIKTC